MGTTVWSQPWENRAEVDWLMHSHQWQTDLLSWGWRLWWDSGKTPTKSTKSSCRYLHMLPHRSLLVPGVHECGSRSCQTQAHSSGQGNKSPVLQRPIQAAPSSNKGIIAESPRDKKSHHPVLTLTSKLVTSSGFKPLVRRRHRFHGLLHHSTRCSHFYYGWVHHECH